MGGEADAKHVYFHADAISMEIHVIVTFSDTQTDRHTDTQTYVRTQKALTKKDTLNHT